MAAGRQLHVPRPARLYRRRPWPDAGFRQRLRHHALARHARAQARRRSARVHAGDHGVPQRAAAADRLQGQCLCACAPARASRLHRRQALRRGRQPGRRIPHRRPVHLDRLYPQRPRHPVSAPQDRSDRAACRLQCRQPFRQVAGQCAGAVSARRAVPDRRRHAVRVRAGDPSARRAAARARAGAARPVRPFRVGSGVRAARTLRQRDPRQDRRVSRQRLQRPRFGLLSVLPGRPAGAGPLHHRPLRRPDSRGRTRHARGGYRRHRAQLDRRARRRAGSDQRAGQGAGTACPLSQTRSRSASTRPIRPPIAAGDIRIIEGLERAASARRRFPSPATRKSSARSD